MSVRIRVYPTNGGYGGLGGYGVNSQQYFQQQLSNERKVSSLKLAYERQLMQQQLQLVKLQTQMQYGGYGYGAAPVIGAPVGGVTNAWLGNGTMGYNSFNPFTSGSSFFGGLGLGGMF
jgi:hypothetical protein